jgi:hypothetical protein
MSNSQEKNEDRGTQDTQHGDASGNTGGRSGEGAASAMQQLISQSREHRHHTGEADDAAGGGQGQ